MARSGIPARKDPTTYLNAVGHAIDPPPPCANVRNAYSRAMVPWRTSLPFVGSSHLAARGHQRRGGLAPQTLPSALSRLPELALSIRYRLLTIGGVPARSTLTHRNASVASRRRIECSRRAPARHICISSPPLLHVSQPLPRSQSRYYSATPPSERAAGPFGSQRFESPTRIYVTISGPDLSPHIRSGK